MNCKKLSKEPVMLNSPEIWQAVTDTITENYSTDKEINISNEFETYLLRMNTISSPLQVEHKEKVLIYLEDFYNKWVFKEAIEEEQYPESYAKEMKGKLFVFGSFKLGVDSADADIDTLFVAPRFITRERFFTCIYGLLKDHPDTSEIIAVPVAYVPVIKMTFRGVDIDLLFATIDKLSVPKDLDLAKDGLGFMKLMNQQDIRSINGVRVTDDILNSVSNKNTFKIALRIIKLWANCRGIYSNALGFLGGVSWAILVARICQLYPNKSSFTIVQNLFRFFGEKWKWPSPVELRRFDTESGFEELQWTPSGSDTMVILTPSYPSQNSTYNVTRSHLAVMREQMKDGYERCLKINKNEKSAAFLFEPFNFFVRYAHYFVVEYSSADKETYKESSNIIAAKIRLLAGYLESNLSIALVHVYNKSIELEMTDSEDDCDDLRYVKRWFIGYRIAKDVKSLNIFTEIEKFNAIIKVTIKVESVLRSNLLPYVCEEDKGKLEDFYNYRQKIKIKNGFEPVDDKVFFQYSRYFVIKYQSDEESRFIKESTELNKQIPYMVKLLQNNDHISHAILYSTYIDTDETTIEERKKIFVRRWFIAFKMPIGIRQLNIFGELETFKIRCKVELSTEYLKKKELIKLLPEDEQMKQHICISDDIINRKRLYSLPCDDTPTKIQRLL